MNVLNKLFNMFKKDKIDIKKVDDCLSRFVFQINISTNDVDQVYTPEKIYQWIVFNLGVQLTEQEMNHLLALMVDSCRLNNIFIRNNSNSITFMKLKPVKMPVFKL